MLMGFLFRCAIFVFVGKVHFRHKWERIKLDRTQNFWKEHYLNVENIEKMEEELLKIRPVQ
jgi:hypothetical protein